MKNHTQRRIAIVGTGTSSLGSLGASLIAAFAANTAAAPSIKPHTTTLKTNRAYDVAIAGGCKATTPTLNGRHYDSIALGSPTTGRHTFHDADEYARQATTNVISGAATAFGCSFKFTESANLDAATGAS